MTNQQPGATEYVLADRYTQQSGRVFLTGTQALVRILLDQARRDSAAGLKTAGFVSGYRGSPLGALDLELWRAKPVTDAAGIEFLPAVNEDLGATAVLGTQQVETDPNRQVEGVFAMWYGKGPGVDRSGDALKHGNAYGSSPHGGVLVVAGDDHGCVSSSMPHQSDVALMSWFMPVLNPANVAEYLAFGEYGYALSRFSGCWVGFKAISETVESAGSVELHPDRKFASPDYSPPADGLHFRWPDPPSPQIEIRLEAKKAAVFAFADANPIDRHIYAIHDAPFGIVTTGKGHLDLMEALRLLRVDEAACRRLGIDIYKIGMVWPLARRDALKFVQGKREVLVVEEKRGIIESQFKEYFYDYPGDKPERMVGKRDETGAHLVPWTGELSPGLLAQIVAARLHGIFPNEGFAERARKLAAAPVISIAVAGATRTPYFCSGCPHNTSTKVPEGSMALAGIGCHFMASWMDRNTTSTIQMGGEGVNWAASSKFTNHGHVFQNLGDGTWYHSGSMAIRQAIAAKANITYKILYNDAVAMTGGQPVGGSVSVLMIAQICRAEGVQRIALVSDEPKNLALKDFPAGTTLHHRKDMDRLQRELRDIAGVSVLIYVQTCASELRRRRKRGLVADPKRFAVINPAVCEGCGDCSVESNCLSVEPFETDLGPKRRINLSSCNRDFSCLNGFCPSFVTVENATRRRKNGAEIDIPALLDGVKPPAILPLKAPYDLLITGVGGTGVITVGAVVTMAAHLDGLGASVLDFTGFAQKFGPVLSFVRLADRPDAINQVRIDQGAADALIGCDIVVSSSPKASSSYRRGMKSVINLAEMPTGDIVIHRDASLRVEQRVKAIADATGAENMATADTNQLAEDLLGDAVFANTILLGMAWQNGLVPISMAALMRAIKLNAVAVDSNLAAFAIGRIVAAKPAAIAGLVPQKTVAKMDAKQLVAHRFKELVAYQGNAYARKYSRLLKPLQLAEDRLGATDLSTTAARALYQLMAYKDEYEVARLHCDPSFQAHLEAEFEPGFTVKYHLAPPILPRGKDARARPNKTEFGPWMRRVFRFLARLKPLRGTWFDPFGHTAERRLERSLIRWYAGLIETCAGQLGAGNSGIWAEILAEPLNIRGFGPVKKASVITVRARVAALTEKLAD